MNLKEQISSWLVDLFFYLYNMSHTVFAMLYLTLEKSNGLQVKPGLPYLDIIRLLRDNSPLPIAAYQVFLRFILDSNGKVF